METPRAARLAYIFMQGAVHIETVGLAQNEYWDSRQFDAGTPLRDCRVCATGAIVIAIGGTPNPDNLSAIEETDYQDALKAASAHLDRPLALYNDVPGRTAQDVAAALCHVARHLLSAVMEGAAAYLEKVGLHQGSLHDNRQTWAGVPLDECGVCPIGALYVAVYGELFPQNPGEPSLHTTYQTIVKLAEKHLGQRVPDWSDAPGRTTAEVAAMWRKTAERTRTGELTPAA